MPILLALGLVSFSLNARKNHNRGRGRKIWVGLLALLDTAVALCAPLVIFVAAQNSELTLSTSAIFQVYGVLGFPTLMFGLGHGLRYSLDQIEKEEENLNQF